MDERTWREKLSAAYGDAAWGFITPSNQVVCLSCLTHGEKEIILSADGAATILYAPVWEPSGPCSRCGYT